MYIADYHVHTKLSADGIDDADSIVKSAVKKGVNELCFTNHAEVGTTVRMPGDDLDFSFRGNDTYVEYLNCIENYGGKINLKYGIELGEPMQNPVEAQQIMEKYAFRFDFVISSLHSLDNELDFYQYDYVGVDLNALFRKYLNELDEHIRWHDYDVLGHITYPLRYIVGEHGYSLDMKRYMGDIYDIFRVIAENDHGIEVNTSGLRQKLGVCMPDYDIIKLYKEAGGKIITIGSDTHDKENIGAGISEAQEILKNAGFKYFTVFDKRKPKFIEIQ